MKQPKLLARIIVANKNGQILIVRRSKTAPRRALTWEMPGGIIEPEEDPKATALRELQEEAGLAITSADYVYAGTSPDYKYTAFFFFANSDDQQVTLSYEHDQYQWVNLDKAIEMVAVDGYKKALKFYKEFKLNRYKVIVSTKCLLLNKGTYLLLKRSAQEKLGPGLWDLPGGRIEQQETVYQSMIRELSEETGLSAHSFAIMFAYTEINKNELKIRIGLDAKTNKSTVKLSNEHSEYLWAPKGKTYSIANHPAWPGWGEFVKIFG